MLYCVYSGGLDSSFNYLSEVLRYNPDMDQWEKIGDLDTPRYMHETSAVKWDVIEPFCN